MRKPKKAAKTNLIEVLLLESDKKDAHLRLESYPSIWSYAEDFFAENCEIFEYKGFLIWSGWAGPNHGPKVFENLMKNEKCLEAAKTSGLFEVVNWATKNYPNTRGWGDPPGMDHLCFIRLLDGTWLAGEYWRQWIKLNPDPKDESGRSGYDFRPYQKKLNYSNRPCWNTNAEIVGKWDVVPEEIRHAAEVFPASWKKSRDQYKKVMKNTGEAEKLAKVEKNKDHVKRTKIRMDVVAQANKVRDLIEVYVSRVNNETMTVEDISELYTALTELGTRNKTMKKIYGAKMAKK